MKIKYLNEGQKSSRFLSFTNSSMDTLGEDWTFLFNTRLPQKLESFDHKIAMKRDSHWVGLCHILFQEFEILSRCSNQDFGFTFEYVGQMQ